MNEPRRPLTEAGLHVAYGIPFEDLREIPQVQWSALIRAIEDEAVADLARRIEARVVTLSQRLDEPVTGTVVAALLTTIREEAAK